jgi:hypothetical protein
MISQSLLETDHCEMRPFHGFVAYTGRIHLTTFIPKAPASREMLLRVSTEMAGCDWMPTPQKIR